MAQLAELITPRTRLVSLVHVSNMLGASLPAHDVVELARRVGAKVRQHLMATVRFRGRRGRKGTHGRNAVGGGDGLAWAGTGQPVLAALSQRKGGSKRAMLVVRQCPCVCHAKRMHMQLDAVTQSLSDTLPSLPCRCCWTAASLCPICRWTCRLLGRTGLWPLPTRCAAPPALDSSGASELVGWGHLG